MAKAKEFTYRGLQLMYVRRRYGKQFFCWLHYRDADNNWQTFGDPWPQANISKKDLDTACTSILEKGKI